MRHLIILLAYFSAATFAESTYLGNDKDGIALSPKEAIEIAKPYLYESYRLRVQNSPESETEFWEIDYLRTHVLVENDYYLIVRSLPKKFVSQYEIHAVEVHKYTGEAKVRK